MAKFKLTDPRLLGQSELKVECGECGTFFYEKVSGTELEVKKCPKCRNTNNFALIMRERKDNKFPCSEYCDKLKNKEKFKTCDECTSWYKKVKINMNDAYEVVGITIDDKKEGTKFDAGKPRLGEMIMDFRKPLLEVIKVWEFGANKYAKSNWKKVENGEERYTNALARHFAAEMDEVVDAETKLHHAIHVAWNALARLYFIIKDGE